MTKPRQYHRREHLKRLSKAQFYFSRNVIHARNYIIPNTQRASGTSENCKFQVALDICTRDDPMSHLSFAHIIRFCAVWKFFEKSLVLGIKDTMQFSCKSHKLRIIACYAIFCNKLEHIFVHWFSLIRFQGFRQGVKQG